MDPLSICTSVITIASLCVTLLERFRQFYEAPEETLAVINDISYFQIVLSQVGSKKLLEQHDDLLVPAVSLDAQCAEYTSSQAIATISTHARTKLLELKEIVQSCLGSHASSLSKPSKAGVKIARLSWMRQRHRVREIQRELAGIRLTMCTLFGIDTSSCVSRIELAVDDISFLGKNLSSGQDVIMHTQDKFHTKMSEEIRAQGKLLRQLHEALSSPPGSSGSPTFSIASTTPFAATDSHSSLRTIRSTKLIRRHSMPPQTQIERPSIGLSHSYRRTSEPPINPHRAGILFERDNNDIRITLSHAQQVLCNIGCNCLCHARHRLRTPKLFDQILGALFVNSTGWLKDKVVCNERNCRRNSSSSAKFTYYFPSWALARKLYLQVLYNSFNEPQVSLRAPQVVSSSSNVFLYAELGNLRGIQNLYANGLASPHDVCFGLGTLALHHALWYCQVDTVKFLLDVKSDVEVENNMQKTALDIVREKAFILPTDAESKRQQLALVEMFQPEDYLKDCQLSVISKIVLEMAPLDLESTLEASTATIDDTDSHGMTALSWAAARADNHSLQLLLNYGANPNIPDSQGYVPLHWACEAENPLCILPLLKAGANMAVQDAWGDTPFTTIIPHQQNIEEYLIPFLERGVDVNSCGHANRSVVAQACIFNRPQGLALLQSYDADMKHCDCDGLSPIFHAIRCRSYEALAILLSRKSEVNFQIVSKAKETILHVAAIYADARILDLLCEADIGPMETGIKNVDGFSAEDLMARNKGAHVEAVVAFEKFMKSLLGKEKIS